MEIGDRVVRKQNEQKGYIHDVRQGRIIMVNVRWLGGVTAGEWLPAEEVRVWDKLPLPPLPAPKRRKRPHRGRPVTERGGGMTPYYEHAGR